MVSNGVWQSTSQASIQHSVLQHFSAAILSSLAGSWQWDLLRDKGAAFTEIETGSLGNLTQDHDF